MKKLTSLIALFSLVTISVAARASQMPMQDVQVANLEVEYLSKKQNWLAGTYSATATLNLTTNTITLTANQVVDCPACFDIQPDGGNEMIAPQTYTVELPIIKASETDACGSVHYVALQDKRPADGMLEKIELIDNTQNTCETFRALSPTEVTYYTTWYNHRRDGKGSRVSATSRFKGSALERLVWALESKN